MVKAYLNYRRKARNRHGIHSPFVYGLVEEVFRAKEWNKRKAVKALRKELKNCTDEIEITDFGAGSRVDNAPRRSIAKIVDVSSTPLRNAGLLQRLATHLGCENILELGTNLGLATAAMAASPGVKKLISLEGDANLSAIARSNLDKLNLKAEIITGTFEGNLSKALSQFEKLDLAYIDGNHRRDPTLDYFDAIANKTDQNGVIVVGDIHWSKEMEAAWEAIKKRAEVRVTIDIFTMGLVFFRKEMTPEHFIIHYK